MFYIIYTIVAISASIPFCFGIASFNESTHTHVGVAIDVDRFIHITDERYLSVGIDSSVLRHHWETFDFNSKKLLVLAAALSPAYVRFGGNDAEWLVFTPNITETIDKKKRPRPSTNFTMTVSDLDKLNEFAISAGWYLLFDFNAFLRRGSSWDPNNALKILRYCVKKNYTNNLAFELGNEPNDYHHYNKTLSPAQIGHDVLKLWNILKTEFGGVFARSVLVGPDVTRPERSYSFFKSYLRVVKSTFPLSAVTWHQYYLNGRQATWEDFIDSSVMDKLTEEIATVQEILKDEGLADRKMWLGETSSAFGGGATNLSDTYIAGFLWLDKLGIAARMGVDLVVRQSFYGANYAMIDKHLKPLPDYWLSLLYKKLVGHKVLNTTVLGGAKDIRVYAHCTNLEKTSYPRGAITVYALNIQILPTTLHFSEMLSSLPKDQYLLTHHGPHALKSRHVELNGRQLKMIDGKKFPPLSPFTLDVHQHVIIPAYSFSFYVIPAAKSHACL